MLENHQILQLIILFLSAILIIIGIRKFILSRKEDNTEDSLASVDYQKFNLEDDIYSLRFLISIVANEYVDRFILNANEDKTGHKKIKIPDTDTEHQKHVNNITNLVMNILSDEHILQLNKYIAVSNLKYITRILIKKAYNDLIDSAVEYRLQEMKNQNENVKRRNMQEQSNLPASIKRILDKYDMSIIDAKNVVRNNKADLNDVSLRNMSDADKEYYQDLKELNNHFK